MLNIFATFATDEALETKGVWKNVRGARFLIARDSNPAYTKLLNEQVQARAFDLEDQAEDGKAAQKVSEAILVDVMAQTILLGWEKVSFDGKTEVPYSKEAAAQALAVKDFRNVIVRLSSDIDNFLAKREAVQAKN